MSKLPFQLNHFTDGETESERGQVRVTIWPSLPGTVPVHSRGPSIILNGALSFSEMFLFGQSMIWSPW